LETKIKKFKTFFTPFSANTYIKISVYIFVDFRIKRAGSFNYGGLPFFASGQKTGKKQNYGNSVCHSRAGGNPYFALDPCSPLSRGQVYTCFKQVQG